MRHNYGIGTSFLIMVSMIHILACTKPARFSYVSGDYALDLDWLRINGRVPPGGHNFEDLKRFTAFSFKDGVVKYLAWTGTYEQSGDTVILKMEDRERNPLFVNLSTRDGDRAILKMRVNQNGTLGWLRNDGSEAMRFVRIK